MKSLTRALAVAGAFLSAPSAFAQTASPGGALVPGSADVIHDVLGLAIGMPCDDAIPKAKAMFTGTYDHRYPLGWVFHQPKGGEVRFDHAPLKWTYTEYMFTLHDNDSTKTKDYVTFRCIEDGASRQVISFQRMIQFLDLKLSPTVASLAGLFQEKYGVPSITFSPTYLATMFNQNGIINTPTNDCGEYKNGYFYKHSELAYTDFDKFNCTYTLTFKAIEAKEPPGAVSELDIEAIDFQRFGNIVRDAEKHRLEITPAVLPKL